MYRLALTSLNLTVCLMVSKIVYATCGPLEVTASGFGSHHDNSTVTTPHQIGTITVTCDGEYRLGLDAGTQPLSLRRLNNGTGHFLSYRLWQDANGSQEWGDDGLFVTTYPAPTLKTTGDNSPIVHTIFGTTMTPDTAVGQYTDTVQVTLAYPPFGPNDRQITTLPLSMQMVGSCTIDAGGIVGFGSRPTDSPDLSGVALGAFSVNCSSGIHYGIGIDAGQYFNGKQRYMSDGTHHVSYTLWANQAGTQEWGDGGLNAIEPTYVETYPALAQFGDGIGSPQAIFLWGDVALRSSKAPIGIYQDSVVVTIVW